MAGMVRGKLLDFAQVMHRVREVLEQLLDSRRGKNQHYRMADAGVSAFSVFFMRARARPARGLARYWPSSNVQVLSWIQGMKGAGKGRAPEPVGRAAKRSVVAYRLPTVSPGNEKAQSQNRAKSLI